MNKLYIIIFNFALLAVMSCSDNLYGNGGGGSDCGKDIKCWRVKAENEFRSGNYQAAYKSYGEIVKLDSTASAGYFGMAKSGLWMKGVNPFDVFRFLKIEDDKIPFVDDSIKVQNRYLQGMKVAAISLKELQRRDSLTALYEIHKKDSLGQVIQPDEKDELDSLRKYYCIPASKNGVCKDNYGKGKPFPISDREYKFNSYSGGLLISFMAKSILELLDWNNDGCITKKGTKGVDNPGDPIKDSTEWRKWGCEKKNGGYSYDISVKLEKDEYGNIIINTNNMMEELDEIIDEYYKDCIDSKPEFEFCEIPSEIEDINNKLDEFADNLLDVMDLLNGLGAGDKKGELCENDELGCKEENGKWQDEINKYKDYASFYKIGTRIDEDGDGCIDEDLLDGMDNDGDGLKNANARIAQTNLNSPQWGLTNMLGYHSMTGNPEMDKPIRLPAPQYICNFPPGMSGHGCRATELWPPDDDTTGYVTVIAFTQTSGYWTSDNLDDKLAVAQDTVCGELKYSLEERKALIGGCWLFYNQEKFIKYWLKRELASPLERRVHDKCKNCVGDECTKKKQ